MYHLRKLFVFIVFCIAGFFGFEYFKVHTSSDVIAYKRFAKGVLNKDTYAVRTTSVPDVASATFAADSERREYYHDLKIRFTYFKILSHFQTEDGKDAEIVAEQISRVSRPGHSAFWGDAEVTMYHTVKLEKRNGIWRVVSFEDPAMR